jgi:hypothetical protein
VIILNKTPIHLDITLYYVLLYIMSFTHTPDAHISALAHRLLRHLLAYTYTHVRENCTSNNLFSNFFWSFRAIFFFISLDYELIHMTSPPN